MSSPDGGHQQIGDNFLRKEEEKMLPIEVDDLPPKSGRVKIVLRRGQRDRERERLSPLSECWRGTSNGSNHYFPQVHSTVGALLFFFRIPKHNAGLLPRIQGLCVRRIVRPEKLT